MEKIISLSPEVIQFLKKLVWILYEKEYFRFQEDAHDYANKLENSIRKDLPTIKHHISPEELKHYGKFYAKIKSNQRTTWYVFFDQSANRILVQFMANNHVPESEFLNRL